MKVSKENLKKLKANFLGYIEGEKVDQFLDCYDINFAAGHWFAGDFADRFATGGYNTDVDSCITEQIKRVSHAVIKSIEFHEAVFI